MIGLLNWLSSPGLFARRRGALKTDVKHSTLVALAAFLLLSAAVPVRASDDTEPQLTGPSAEIINKYLEATQSHEDSLRGASMEIDINADVPKLKEHGRLHALRKISKVGQITYHVLGFQGDSTIKNQVIARYLQAEQQGQGDESLAITPDNYKFKYKGEKDLDGKEVYVFQLSPRKKKVGLFKGEICLDTGSYLPVYEKGRFVKNPSIFFRKVDFERAFAIQNGIAIPQSMTSTIDVRLIGKVQLSINYSKFAQNTDTADAQDSSNSALLRVSADK